MIRARTVWTSAVCWMTFRTHQTSLSSCSMPAPTIPLARIPHSTNGENWKDTSRYQSAATDLLLAIVLFSLSLSLSLFLMKCLLFSSSAENSSRSTLSCLTVLTKALPAEIPRRMFRVCATLLKRATTSLSANHSPKTLASMVRERTTTKHCTQRAKCSLLTYIPPPNEIVIRGNCRRENWCFEFRRRFCRGDCRFGEPAQDSRKARLFQSPQARRQACCRNFEVPPPSTTTVSVGAGVGVWVVVVVVSGRVQALSLSRHLMQFQVVVGD